LNRYGALQQIEIAKYLGLVSQRMRIDQSSIIFNLLANFSKMFTRLVKEQNPYVQDFFFKVLVLVLIVTNG